MSGDLDFLYCFIRSVRVHTIMMFFSTRKLFHHDHIAHIASPAPRQSYKYHLMLMFVVPGFQNLDWRAKPINSMPP